MRRPLRAPPPGAGQGGLDGGWPSLFRNTAFGRANADDLVMAILDGPRRQPDRLSDR